MAKKLEHSYCGLCSGETPTKDRILRENYWEVRGDKEEISKVVETSPCAALKMALTFRDEQIMDELLIQCGRSQRNLRSCNLRLELVKNITGYNWDIAETLPLSRLVSMTRDALNEHLSSGLFEDPKVSPYFFNHPDLVFGKPSPPPDEQDRLAAFLEDSQAPMQVRRY